MESAEKKMLSWGWCSGSPAGSLLQLTVWSANSSTIMAMKIKKPVSIKRQCSCTETSKGLNSLPVLSPALSSDARHWLVFIAVLHHSHLIGPHFLSGQNGHLTTLAVGKPQWWMCKLLGVFLLGPPLLIGAKIEHSHCPIICSTFQIISDYNPDYHFRMRLPYLHPHPLYKYIYANYHTLTLILFSKNAPLSMGTLNSEPPTPHSCPPTNPQHRYPSI